MSARAGATALGCALLASSVLLAACSSRSRSRRGVHTVAITCGLADSGATPDHAAEWTPR